MAYAEKRVDELNVPKLRVKLLAAITSYYISQKDMVMMEKYFDSTATLINESRSVEMAASGLQLLADMSSQTGDYKLAYRMMRSMNTYKDIFRTEHMDRIGAEIRNAAEADLREKQIEYLNLLNKLKEEKLSKEELQRIALLRENILKDSSLANQQLLMSAMQTESVLRNQQLEKEKELRLALSRENELKQQMLTGERKSKKLLWAGLGAMTLLGAIIFLQNRRQQKKNQIIRKQSAELEVLNKEIHHRVKNNLQVISSMLDLQSQSLQDEKAAAIIREGIQRVQSMAFIHQNLYQGNAVNSVNMQEYIRMLTTHLFQTYNIRTDKIQLHTHIEDPGLHTDTAIPLGMILNELISNALKYAFAGREKGDIWINMKKMEQGLYLEVKDNGVGLPPGFDPDTTSTFGYEIIKAFAQKMKARMHINRENGTAVQLIITKFKTTA
jgi:two-component system, sensor histidine kinase PdtaS